jgi:hypothetical protein
LGARREDPSDAAHRELRRIQQRQPVPVLEAVLERITYAGEETGYTIARVATDRTGPNVLTVVGPLLGAPVGENLRLTGRWGSHPKYGRQFQVHSFTTGVAGYDPAIGLSIALREVVFPAVDRGCRVREHDLWSLAVDEP